MRQFSLPRKLPQPLRFAERRGAGRRLPRQLLNYYDEAERELRAKGADIVFVGRFKDLAPNIFMRDNSGNLIEFIEQPDLW